jgi:DNA modification methylase
MARNIVSCACPEGGIVYDPFMGSGTTAIATVDIGGDRKYLGSEISEEYCKMAKQRIQIEESQLTLF